MIAHRRDPGAEDASGGGNPGDGETPLTALQRITAALDELLNAARATERMRIIRGLEEDQVGETVEHAAETRLRTQFLAGIDVRINQIGLGPLPPPPSTDGPSAPG